MTPKEKAKELVGKMSMGEEFNGSLELMELYSVPKNKYNKECALVAVDEMIKEYKRIAVPYVADKSYVIDIEYWQEVKQEIEKL
jgi:hypothetical protein